MHVVAPCRRWRKARHHGGVLTMQAIDRDPRSGGEIALERIGELGRAIENHAQPVVVFAEIGIFHDLLQIGFWYEAADADAGPHNQEIKERLPEPRDPPHWPAAWRRSGFELDPLRRPAHLRST